MPYYFDAHEEPKMGSQSWDQIEEIWETIKNDLMAVVFESKQEALDEKFRPHEDKTGYRFSNWSLIRYRKSDDEDMLRYYHELGLEALTHTEHAIKNKTMDAWFVYHWGMLAACHGYVQCAAMANANDLSSERAGVAGGNATRLDQHRNWFSHYYLKLKEETGLRRFEIEDKIEGLIKAILKGEFSGSKNLETNWFEAFLNLRDSEETNPNYGQLTGSFRDRKLTVAEMRRLIKQPTENLPPLNLIFPDP